MARTAIALQNSPNDGTGLNPVVFSAGDAPNNHEFVNDGFTKLHVKNGGGGAVVATVKSVACSHGRTGDVVESVGAGDDAVLGPFDTTLFNQADGKVQVDLDIDTSVTLAAIKQVQ